MPLFGFLTEEDLKPLATKEDLKIFVNKDDLKPFVSEDIVAKVTSDLKKDFEKNSSDLKKDLEKNSSLIKSLNEKSDCTKIINGIHICDSPLYENVKSPFELTYKDIFQGSDFCVGIKSVYDVVPPKYRERVSAKYTSGLDSDLPDNYVCVEGKKGRNYLDTIVDSKIVDYMSKHGEKYPFHKTNPEHIMDGRCYSKCYKYTCDEIKNGAVGKEREKKETTVSKNTRNFLIKKSSATHQVIYRRTHSIKNGNII